MNEQPTRCLRGKRKLAQESLRKAVNAAYKARHDSGDGAVETLRHDPAHAILKALVDHGWINEKGDDRILAIERLIEQTLKTDQFDSGRLLRAIAWFKETRGKHDGPHEFYAGNCKLCQEAYVRAEEILDAYLLGSNYIAGERVETPDLGTTWEDLARENLKNLLEALRQRDQAFSEIRELERELADEYEADKEIQAQLLKYQADAESAEAQVRELREQRVSQYNEGITKGAEIARERERELVEALSETLPFIKAQEVRTPTAKVVRLIHKIEAALIRKSQEQR